VNHKDRYRLLHGPYQAPRHRLGRKLFCEIYGWVAVRQVSDGRIPWPMSRPKEGGTPFLILCGDLVQAVRRESNQAVAHWWGVADKTVSKWRKALDVPRFNEGTLRLSAEYFAEHIPEEVRIQATLKASAPEANRKKALANAARPVSAKALQALRRHWGKGPTAEGRRRLSELHKGRGTRPPAAGRPWTPDELALLGTLPDADVAQRIDRTVGAIRCMRFKRGIATAVDRQKQ
jgi:hypothetical protein